MSSKEKEMNHQNQELIDERAFWELAWTLLGGRWLEQMVELGLIDERYKKSRLEEVEWDEGEGTFLS